MKNENLDERKKKLTRLISSELKKTFNSSSAIMGFIRDLEQSGLSVDITIVTAITVEEKTTMNFGDHEVTAEKDGTLELNKKDVRLTSEDKHFLESLKLTY